MTYEINPNQSEVYFTVFTPDALYSGDKRSDFSIGRLQDRDDAVKNWSGCENGITYFPDQYQELASRQCVYVVNGSVRQGYSVKETYI